MKIFKLTLSLYILLLSCFPCGDGLECNGKDELKISASVEHKNHSHESESCTPFCTCSCCAASTFFQFSVPAVKIPKAVFAAVKFPLYADCFRPELSFSIWQPPKIA
ncbi:DUF6660 family protein [Dyadobacter frigoris]|uniref:DUF2946 domain-containing protein n=1 Tax=Dyadobacter frigoris TaxID=2576211 RepID=A0A4U6DAN5_9BACT|nr:DUF6660 family protein [Dyadobacter frigoris]TKT93238.1 hypothetical protein FDK13_05110 [Dyadobacter frigoris]